MSLAVRKFTINLEDYHGDIHKDGYLVFRYANLMDSFAISGAPMQRFGKENETKEDKKAILNMIKDVFVEGKARDEEGELVELKKEQIEFVVTPIMFSDIVTTVFEDEKSNEEAKKKQKGKSEEGEG